MDNPRVVAPGQWLAARKDLLAREKDAIRAKDAVDAARRARGMADGTANCRREKSSLRPPHRYKTRYARPG